MNLCWRTMRVTNTQRGTISAVQKWFVSGNRTSDDTHCTLGPSVIPTRTADSSLPTPLPPSPPHPPTLPTQLSLHSRSKHDQCPCFVMIVSPSLHSQTGCSSERVCRINKQQGGIKNKTRNNGSRLTSQRTKKGTQPRTLESPAILI